MSDRSHLTPLEVDRLLAATREGRYPERDRCLLLLLYRHGLRVSEACGMTLGQVDVDSRVLHVRRLKRGLSTTHPLRPEELTAIRAWLKRRGKIGVATDCFFVSERGGPLTRQQVYYLVKRYGELAGLPVPAHPHMLRHACGYALADQGADTRLIQDYLGHRAIQHTVRYTATNVARFGKLWR
jgi:type 1 fimbriae regulatory protein FimB